MFIGVLAYLIIAINLGILAVNKWGFIWWFGLLEYVRRVCCRFIDLCNRDGKIGFVCTFTDEKEGLVEY